MVDDFGQDKFDKQVGELQQQIERLYEKTNKQTKDIESLRTQAEQLSVEFAEMDATLLSLSQDINNLRELLLSDRDRMNTNGQLQTLRIDRVVERVEALGTIHRLAPQTAIDTIAESASIVGRIGLVGAVVFLICSVLTTDQSDTFKDMAATAAIGSLAAMVVTREMRDSQ